jgi:hypothetical protein
MAGKQRTHDKKYFTVAEANARLPLVRAIVRDIGDLARALQERQERLARVQPPERQTLADAYREELEQAQADMARDHDRLREYEQELRTLGVVLKDHFLGLVDFPARINGREVYLCWKLDEPEVAFWHELDAGFAGRKQIPAEPAKA